METPYFKLQHIELVTCIGYCPLSCLHYNITFWKLGLFSSSGRKTKAGLFTTGIWRYNLAFCNGPIILEYLSPFLSQRYGIGKPKKF